ncbi:MAG: hypothetical protein RLZ44_1615 [Pseudomonadota bacterium]
MTREPTPQPPATPQQLALQAAAATAPQPTGLVAYRSEGRVLLIGEPLAVTAALQQLDPGLLAHCLFTSKPPTAPRHLSYQVCELAEIELTGHLGAFRVDTPGADPGQPETRFDLVLDLASPPRLAMPLPPAGYFAPQTPEALHEALATLPGLVGRFEKPQFFDYDPAICAHGASGIAGCRRCLDACPAEAIVSIGERVQVDPYLCQGGGICATVCPSGAMTYRYPTAADTLQRVRRMLHAFRTAGGEQPVLMLHAADHPVTPPDERTLPLALEELASAGLELWLGALAYGARRVALARDPAMASKVAAALEEQRGIANAMLQGLGYPAAVHWHQAPEPSEIEGLDPASFAAQGDKRQNLFLALDHLTRQAPAAASEALLPDGAPLGRVDVAAGCTLCLACTSVCPTKALADGGDRPALRFFEANCVQCGLCVKACPEQVMRLTPRVLYDAERRRQPLTLNAEEPFCCVSCGKPFATRSVIEKMQQKLAGHWMYQDEAARRRLSMCDDCRVADMMRSAS